MLCKFQQTQQQALATNSDKSDTTNFTTEIDVSNYCWCDINYIHFHINLETIYSKIDIA